MDFDSIVSITVGVISLVVLPLVAVIYSNLSKRIDSVDHESKASIKDLNVNLRHSLRNVNDKLVDSLVLDRNAQVAHMIKSMEMLRSVLEDRAKRAILKDEDL